MSYLLNDVNYHETTASQMGGVSGFCERAGNFFSAPARWVAAETWNGGKKYTLVVIENEIIVNSKQSKMGFCKVARIVVGAILSPLIVLGVIFKALSFLDRETYLKHKYSETTLDDKKFTDAEFKELEELIRVRKDKIAAANQTPNSERRNSPAVALGITCMVMICVAAILAPLCRGCCQNSRR